IADVPGLQPEPREFAEFVERLGRSGVGERVEHHDGGAPLEELANHGGADEPGTAGYKDPAERHDLPPEPSNNRLVLTPHLCSRKAIEVRTTPSPYTTLREKLIDEA